MTRRCFLRRYCSVLAAGGHVHTMGVRIYPLMPRHHSPAPLLPTKRKEKNPGIHTNPRVLGRVDRALDEGQDPVHQSILDLSHKASNEFFFYNSEIRNE